MQTSEVGENPDGHYSLETLTVMTFGGMDPDDEGFNGWTVEIVDEIWKSTDGGPLDHQVSKSVDRPWTVDFVGRHLFLKYT